MVCVQCSSCTRSRYASEVGSLRRQLTIGLAGAAALTALCVPAAARHLRAVGLLLGAIGAQDPFGLTQRVAHPLREEDGELVLSGRKLRTRAYRPTDLRAPPGVVLLPGVHHEGIDEARFRRLARSIAATGSWVLTPELSELSEYRIEAATIDSIAGAVEQHARLTGGSVGAWGISFGGGLLLLAATRPVVRDALAYVVTVGAHHDLTRVASYYAGQAVLGPDREPPNVEPHPYGARVLIHAYIDRLFGAENVDAARRALRYYVEDRFDRARAVAGAVPGEDGLRLRRLLDGAKGEIARELTEVASAHARDLAGVSPRGQLASLRVPTFLLHGTDDSVIPSLETRYLAREIPAQAMRRVLVTPVLGHADLSEKLPWRAYLDIVRFTAAVLHLSES
jgi:pimeloyl-ACP methyl ester carboxylesterase